MYFLIHIMQFWLELPWRRAWDEDLSESNLLGNVSRKNTEWGPETRKGWVGRRREKSKQDCDNQFSLVQVLSSVWLFATPWTAAHQASMSPSTPQRLPLWAQPWNDRGL